MKIYTLMPREGEPITDLIDEAETNGKLVLPMVDGEFLLTVKTITNDEARAFRKERANAEAPAPAAEAADSDGGTGEGPNGPKPGYSEEQIVDAAMAAHEANRAYCESIGDTSQPLWEHAPQWQRDSAINGVKFAIANSFPSGEAMHQNWYNVKLADGWVYGEVKDPDKKTHPCMVAYAELPEAQRAKDDIFRKTIMASLGAAE